MATLAALAALHGAPSDSKLLGQRVMVGMNGTTPSAGLLASVRAGRVGAVILFGSNIVSTQQVTALTGALQRAARAGGNPPLLIATDQEGGIVKRFRSGPPALSPPQMASAGAATARRQGRLTGQYMKARGVNMDLAPVSDVPTSSGAFIWRQGRAFSFNPNTVAADATAFAQGLQAAGVAATAKHFPGVGSATVDTDFQLDELHPSAAQRAGALKPYQKLIPGGVDAVMLSTAGFPAYDPSGAPAALSRPIIATLLRGQLRFGGVTITDALESPTGHNQVAAGVLAAAAGADILLYTDSAPGELAALEAALRSGRISRAQALASYNRIVALKAKLG